MNIMMNSKRLVCTTNILSIISIFLSTQIELCYIPYNELYNNINKNILFYNLKNYENNDENNCYICGCVKNCSNYLENVFKNILEIRKIFNKIKVIIAYDNSSDNSLKILYKLKDLYKNNFDIVIIINNNKSKYKTENISNARNSILKYINKESIQYKYFIMMDFDDVSEYDINISILEEYLNRNDWDSLSFNRKNYYDIWALSIAPFYISCWHWNKNQDNSSYVVNIMKEYIKNKLLTLNSEELLECSSAFNSIAIYRTEKFINCSYSNNVFKSHSFLETNHIKENINNLNILTNKDNTFYTILLEDCEHRHFHLEAIKKNNAKIRISPLYLFFDYTEDNCKYVSSRGILKSCDVKSLNPISSVSTILEYDTTLLKDGCTFYVCNYAIKNLITNLNKISYKIILVSGDSDCTVPNEIFNDYNDFIQFIENEKIIAWFSQNCVLNHPKLHKIPIGLDYHTMSKKDTNWGKKISPYNQELLLNKIKNESKIFWKREIKCYANYHFSMNTKYGNDRKDAFNNINKELVFYEPHNIEREESWEKQSNYAFVISPHGNGLDCHRTWEALCLGCIPIIKKSNMSDIFEELPVLIVDNWSNIDYLLLKNTILLFENKYNNKKFNYDKLNLNYWMEKIKKFQIT